MNGSLRIDITECKCALGFQHARGRHGTGHDSTEQAIGHGPILTCDVLRGLRTYMVATLLTSSAPLMISRSRRARCMCAENAGDQDTGARAMAQLASPGRCRTGS